MRFSDGDRQKTDCISSAPRTTHLPRPLLGISPPAMRHARMLLMTAWCVIVSPSISTKFLSLFRRVRVSRTTVLASVRLDTLLIAPEETHTFRCSSACNFRPWCELWCDDIGSDQCLFSNAMVLPAYQETDTADAMTCYTRRQREFAAGALVQATPDYGGKLATNLADGFYDGQTLSSCYHTQLNTNKPWLLLDFRAPVTFRRAKLVTQPAGAFSTVQQTRSIEIRTGMAVVGTPGDFTSYAFFGNFAGPATEYGQEVIIEAPETVTARFLSLQKMEDSTFFQICHLEVY